MFIIYFVLFLLNFVFSKDENLILINVKITVMNLSLFCQNFPYISEKYLGYHKK